MERGGLSEEKYPSILRPMDMLGAVETNAEVLAVARAAGFEPSDKQRKDWRRAGLLPRLLKQSGKGRDRGSVVLYPAGTGALLAAVCRHGVRKTPLRDVVILVWWDGHRPADPGLLRCVLGDALDWWERAADPWKDLGSTPAEQQANLERLANGRLSGPLRVVRDRVGGPSPFAALAASLLNAAGGNFEGFTDRPGAGVEDAENDALVGFGVDEVGWFSGDVASVLRDVAVTVRPETLRKALLGATDQELDAARDDARLLSGLIGDVGVLTARLGADALRIAAPFGGYAPSARHLGLFVVWWLSLRRFGVFRKRLAELEPAAALASQLRRMLDVSTVPATEPPRRLQPSGGAAQGAPSPCATSLAPPPKQSRETASWS